MRSFAAYLPHPFVRIVVLAAVCVAPLLDVAVSAQGAPVPRVSYPLEFSVSPPVRSMPPQAAGARAPREVALHRPPARAAGGSVADPVVQTSPGNTSTAQAVGQWEGLGAAYPGFSVTAVPPDPNIAVGPNHIVQWVNGGLVIFDKQGTQLQAPIDDVTFWGSTSTCYQLGGFSDPIVQYDAIANRWVIGEVAIPLFPGLIGQFAQCFAVSTTSDPTGSYYQWAYGFGTSINDYPKIGMWPDAYYISWNIFDGSQAFVGPEACAFDRSAMVNGASSPALVCFKLTTAYASLLPSDLDGATPPPAGSPDFFMSIDPASSALYLWKFHVDFANTKNSTFVGPTSVAGVAPFTSPCLNTQDCIPQPGTTMKLDALGDRLMYRLAYRNFGDHASIVANHTVLTAGGNTGVRWYEVRDPAGTPTVYQQGTFAPDIDNRWMGSIAMDQTGNIGVGYSVGSAVTYPSIRTTGWEVGGTLGILEAEDFAVTGGGSQTGYNRWGDYSAMRIDPSDNCTFWYTQEYQATTQSANWNTRILSFKFPSCGPSRAATTTTLVSSANPSTYGQVVQFTATVSPSAATGTVQFFDNGNAIGTVPLIGGAASLSTSALASGSHSVTAAYSGDSAYSGSASAVLTQIVNGTSSVATSTALASSPNPSVYGQAVVLWATVSPSSGTITPTGTVTFLDGATTLGTAALDSNGVATLSTSALSAGTHSLTAQYAGDSTYSGSTSAAVSQAVTKAGTTTTLASSRNPSNVGQRVTFTASIAPSTATGVVRFFDGTSSLGSATVSGGKASLSTSSLSSGTHSITAQYGGDANFNGSTSAVLTQTVRGKK